MADPKEVRRLQELAFEMRKKLINLCGCYDGIVHIGGDLSMTDLLIGLYHHGMNVDPKGIKAPDRDRFLLSKGHGAVCMYIAMSLRGYFDYDEIVETYGKLDSAYGMHPCKIQLIGMWLSWTGIIWARLWMPLTIYRPQRLRTRQRSSAAR